MAEKTLTGLFDYENFLFLANIGLRLADLIGIPKKTVFFWHEAVQKPVAKGLEGLWFRP